MATHDANIVVNGDADMVIQLEATADRGKVACAGAIDDPAVRDAIVETVDGGAGSVSASAAEVRVLKEGVSMEWLDVLKRIESGEDHVTEFKRGLGDLAGIGKTVAAFANGGGGLLVLGVDDGRTIVGVTESSEAVQERLTAFLQSGCGRPVAAHLGRHQDGRKWVHWIEVRRQRRGYEPFSHGGRYWIRRGRSSVAPSPSELQELMNAFGLVLTEEQVVHGAGVEDLDLRAFREFMKAQGAEMVRDPQPSLEDDLQTATAAEEFDGELLPTLYGLMTFGRNPQGFASTAGLYTVCAAYDGTDRAGDAVSVADVRGRLLDQVQRAGDWFEALGHGERYRGIFREDLRLLPAVALREALVNAGIHRDYAVTGSQIMLEVFADRVDVTSPGGLPNRMTVEQARGGGAPRSRNEMMANAMVVARLMERRGRGWLLMRKYMREFNGTEPELASEEGQFTRVTFRLEAP